MSLFSPHRVRCCTFSGAETRWLVAMVIMLEVLLRLPWFCRELRLGDRSGGRQRWELGAAIVHIRDWSPDIKTFPHSADITQHMTRCLPECVL